MTRKRGLALVLSLTVALLVFAVVGSLFLPKLLGGKRRTGKIPRLTQVGTAALPKDWALFDMAVPQEERPAEPLMLTEEEQDEFLSQFVIDPEFPLAVNRLAQSTVSVLGKDSVNSCLSPLSLYYALALAGSGAEGETKAEFQNVLSEKEDGWAAEQCGNYYRQHYHDGPGSRFRLGTSLWLDGHYHFSEKFLTGAVENFSADLFQADFADKTLGGDMAQWVSDHTDGQLSPSFSTSPQQRLALLNTVDYYAAWITPFQEADNTHDVFHRADGTDVTAEYLNRDYRDSTLYEGEGYQKAYFFLQNRDYMVFLLPDEGVSPQELLSGGKTLEELLLPDPEEQLHCQLRWQIPKFDFSSHHALNDTLQAAGLQRAFDGKQCDFTGIGDEDLFLSDLQQDTRFAIDEQGVTASACTELHFMGAGIPPDERREMVLDRPFLFAVLGTDITAEGTATDDDFHTLLFIGVCGDPTAK